MRIALIGTRGVPARYGGFETAVQEVGSRLAERGHEVVVYCRNAGQRDREYLGMELVNLPAVRHRTLETLSHSFLSVLHAIFLGRPDVAIVFNAANAPFLPLLRAAGIPTSIHVDGLDGSRAKWGKRASAYYRWAEAHSAQWADEVIADARGIVDHLQRTHGITARFIPYGAPIVDPDDRRLADVGVVSRGYHLVVARFEPENHVREIIDGYVSSHCKLPLLVVGDAPYAHAYRADVRAAAAQDSRVRFLGSVWDAELLDTLYAHAATYLHGHSVGGTNPSLLRAMGAGAPVIAYDVVFNREVAGGAGACFADPLDVAHLCEAAEADPVGTAARGRCGQTEVAGRYRWCDVTAEYEALARDLFNSRHR